MCASFWVKNIASVWIFFALPIKENVSQKAPDFREEMPAKEVKSWTKSLESRLIGVQFADSDVLCELNDLFAFFTFESNQQENFIC